MKLYTGSLRNPDMGVTIGVALVATGGSEANDILDTFFDGFGVLSSEEIFSNLGTCDPTIRQISGEQYLKTGEILIDMDHVSDVKAAASAVAQAQATLDAAIVAHETALIAASNTVRIDIEFP